MIIAVKNGVEKEFTERQWNMLSKDKNGWKIQPNEVKKMNESKKAESKDEANTDNSSQSDSGDSGTEKSSDFGIAEAIEKIKEMNAEEAKSFTEGDTRKGVLKALEKMEGDED